MLALGVIPEAAARTHWCIKVEAKHTILVSRWERFALFLWVAVRKCGCLRRQTHMENAQRGIVARGELVGLQPSGLHVALTGQSFLANGGERFHAVLTGVVAIGN